MIPSPGSLRGRLLLGGIAVGISFAVIFGLGATWRVNQLEDRAIDTALLSRLDLARDEVTPKGLLKSDRTSPKIDLVQVIGSDGRVRSSSAALSSVPPLVAVDDVRRQRGGVEVRTALERPDIDLAVLGVRLDLPREGASPAGTGALVVALDAEGFATTTSDLLVLLLVGLVAVVVAIALLSWILTGRALASVTRLTEKAEAAGPGDLVGGLPVPRGDAEVARLVGALNRMLQRLEAGHAKELQFAADAGHRLRTPVATLRAEAELALREVDPVEQRAALGRILADADQLSLVVDRMLARIRSGKDTWEPVVPALTSASSGWQRQASLVGVEIDFRLSSDMSDSARAPEIVAVVEPLVDNAIRHAPSHGTVTVFVSHGAAPDATVTVDVSDTGPGIAPELVAQIFDAWVSTRDASSAGGLGLWLARETARDLGGNVQLVESRRGGTTFRVSLPLAGGSGALDQADGTSGPRSRWSSRARSAPNTNLR